MASSAQSAPVSHKLVWTGRITSALVVLFLLFDGVMKVIKEHHVIAATMKLGYSPDTVAGIGSILLVCVLAYMYPRTAITGAILLTGYLGGAVAVHLRIRDPLTDTLFPIGVGILVWVGLYLRDGRLHALIPWRS
jgi:DoxX-like protein